MIISAVLYNNTNNMSALSILYLVLPFPLAFILHDAAMSGVELLLWGIAGIIFMAINLIFAH